MLRKPSSPSPRSTNPPIWLRVVELTLEAAKALAHEQDELTIADKLLLQSSIDDLVVDTPQSSIALIRFKKLMLKIGKQGADAFKDILVNVISEAARKQLWP